jgi:hypothetical protein
MKIWCTYFNFLQTKLPIYASVHLVMTWTSSSAPLVGGYPVPRRRDHADPTGPTKPLQKKVLFLLVLVPALAITTVTLLREEIELYVADVRFS